jgi:hypothetical protein
MTMHNRAATPAFDTMQQSNSTARHADSFTHLSHALQQGAEQ